MCIAESHARMCAHNYNIHMHSGEQCLCVQALIDYQINNINMHSGESCAYVRA